MLSLTSEVLLVGPFKGLENFHAQIFKLYSFVFLLIPGTCKQSLIRLCILIFLSFFLFFIQKDRLFRIIASYCVSLGESAKLLMPNVLASFPD